MSVRMRHTHAHTRNRRSHHALTEPRLSTCADCGGTRLPHRACPNCGRYRGRVVVDVSAKVLKKEKQKKTRALKAQEAAQETGNEGGVEEEAKPLSAEELSKP